MKEECQINSGDFEDKLTTMLMRLFRAHFNITDEYCKERRALSWAAIYNNFSVSQRWTESKRAYSL